MYRPLSKAASDVVEGGTDYDCGGEVRLVGPAAVNVGIWRIVVILGTFDPKGLVYGI